MQHQRAEIARWFYSMSEQTKKRKFAFESVILTFSFPERVSKKSTRGWLYSTNEVTALGSVWSLPELVRSMAVALWPFFLRRSITLYQHHAPNPPPWTSTKCLGSDTPIAPGGPAGLNSNQTIGYQYETHFEIKHHRKVKRAISLAGLPNSETWKFLSTNCDLISGHSQEPCNSKQETISISNLVNFNSDSQFTHSCHLCCARSASMAPNCADTAWGDGNSGAPPWNGLMIAYLQLADAKTSRASAPAAEMREGGGQIWVWWRSNVRVGSWRRDQGERGGSDAQGVPASVQPAVFGWYLDNTQVILVWYLDDTRELMDMSTMLSGLLVGSGGFGWRSPTSCRESWVACRCMMLCCQGGGSGTDQPEPTLLQYCSLFMRVYHCFWYRN